MNMCRLIPQELLQKYWAPFLEHQAHTISYQELPQLWWKSMAAERPWIQAEIFARIMYGECEHVMCPAALPGRNRGRSVSNNHNNPSSQGAMNLVLTRKGPYWTAKGQNHGVIGSVSNNHDNPSSQGAMNLVLTYKGSYWTAKGQNHARDCLKQSQ